MRTNRINRLIGVIRFGAGRMIVSVARVSKKMRLIRLIGIIRAIRDIFLTK